MRRPKTSPPAEARPHPGSGQPRRSVPGENPDVSATAQCTPRCHARLRSSRQGEVDLGAVLVRAGHVRSGVDDIVEGAAAAAGQVEAELVRCRLWRINLRAVRRRGGPREVGVGCSEGSWERRPERDERVQESRGRTPAGRRPHAGLGLWPDASGVVNVRFAPVAPVAPLGPVLPAAPVAPVLPAAPLAPAAPVAPLFPWSALSKLGLICFFELSR